jgi:hypothetical protein
LRIESRLRNLEQHYEHLYQTLTLPNGERVRYTHDEVMGALSAAIRKREHHLLPYVEQLDTTEGVPSMIRLIKVLMESRDRTSKKGASND